MRLQGTLHHLWYGGVLYCCANMQHSEKLEIDQSTKLVRPSWLIVTNVQAAVFVNFYEIWDIDASSPKGEHYRKWSESDHLFDQFLCNNLF